MTEVTQADRDAAANFMVPSAGGWFAAHGKQHQCDNETMRHLARAFARHRHTAMLEGARLMQEALMQGIKADAVQCDCFARSEEECACGAWDDYKMKPLLELADAIEALAHKGNSRG